MRNKLVYFLLQSIYYLALVVLLIAIILPNTTYYYSNNIAKSFYVRVNTGTIYLMPGENYKIRIFGLRKIASYESKNFKVASVDKSGRITAHRIGKTVVVIKKGKKILKRKVCVIDLSKKRFTILKGKKTRLSVKGTKKGVAWSSCNRKIVKVNRSGRVTALKRGSTYVVAKVKGKKMKCRVIVI